MRRFLLILVLASCTKTPSQSICVMIDTSGTYKDQITEILQQVKLGILPNISGGDHLVLMKIDSSSYEWSNVIAALDVPKSRGEAAHSKRLFSARLDEVTFSSARYTDISGALLYCNEYMVNTDNSMRKMLIYSDMLEELPRNTSRAFRKDEFSGVDFVVVNSKRLLGDQKDPESYRKRMDGWRDKLVQHGAVGFQVYMGSGRVRSFLEKK